MMSILPYFTARVLPQLPIQQRGDFFGRYPDIRFESEAGYVPVASLPVLMLVALTGTGKTTSLETLSRIYTDTYHATMLPSRRDLADFIIIPTAQASVNDKIQPVTNREQRFYYTRLFAEHTEGGMAAIYASLFCKPDTLPHVSEGIRGTGEIEYALIHCPGWQIMELVLNPVTRLKRLSSRKDHFDEATGSDDLTFLPEALQSQVRQSRENGDISAKALTIMRAEAQNYGLSSGVQPHDRYHRLDVDHLSPEDIASEIITLLEKRISRATD